MASDADLTQTFTLNLATNAGGVAASASSALRELGARLKADEGALRQMEQAWKRLNASGTVNIATARALRERIVAQKTAISETQGAILALGGGFEGTARKAGNAGGRMAALTAQLQRMPGPAGGLAARVLSLGDAMRSTEVKGLLLKAGLIALGAAAAFAVAKLAAFGVEVADERRSELLALDGLTKTRFGLYGLAGGYGLAADSASFLQSTIDRVSGSVAIGRDKVADYARSFYAMGLRGGNLQEALEGVSIAASAAGERGASQFQAMAMGAAMMGKSIRAVTDDVRARFGPIVKAQMLSLTTQAAKLRENVRMLFSGLKIDRLLESISAVTSLFSQQTETGRRLQQVMSIALQPLIDGFAVIGPIAKRVFQGMVIGALLIEIGYLKVRNALRSAFGGDLISRLDLTWVYVGIGVGLMAALAAGALALAINVAIALAPLLAVGAAIGAVVFAGYQLFRLWQEIDWTELGVAIGKGLIAGIKRIGSLVYDSVAGLAKGAWGAFASVLGIHSPSTRFQFGGRMTGLGLALGMRESVPGVRAASVRLGAATGAGFGFDDVASSAQAGANGGAGRAGGSVQVHIAEGAVVVHTMATDGESLARDLAPHFATILEGAAEHMGARRVRAA